jgi:hypothetical protein
MVTPQMFVKLVSSGAQLQAQIVGSDDSSAWSLGDDGDVVFFLRSTALGANTGLDGVLVGTPVTPAIAANSAIISNITTDGDMLFAVSDNGHSKGVMMLDGSVGRLIMGGDIRGESNNIDGMGRIEATYYRTGNGDTSNAGYGFNNDNDTGLNLASAGIMNVMVGGVVEASFSATGLTLGGGVVADTAIIFDNAGTLDFHVGLDQGVNDFIIGTGTTLGQSGTPRMTISSTETVFNDDHANHDFRVEGDVNTNMIMVDADRNTMGFFVGASNNYGFWISQGAHTPDVNEHFSRVRMNAQAAVDILASSTDPLYVDTLAIQEPTITLNGGAGTVDGLIASTLRVVSAPTEATNGKNYAFYVQTGVSRFGGLLELSSINAGVTAHTGSSQGDNAITSLITQISVCANGGDAVTLPTATAGAVIIVMNDGANAADVFPASGDNINEAGANTAYSLAVDKNAMFIAHDATHWSVILTA